MKKKKKGFRIKLNIGTFVFMFILFYAVFAVILFLSKRHVETYQVISGPLSGNDTYTALVSRNEQVVKSSADGYVNYFINNASRVSKNDLICCVSPSENVISNVPMDSVDYAELRKLTSSASKSFNSIKFDDIYSLPYSISNILWDSSAANSAAGNFYSAPADGMVSCYVDGYEYVSETELTPDLGQNSGIFPKRLKNSSHVNVGSDLYRIVDGETWCVYFPLTKLQLVRLAAFNEENKSIKVKFLKDNNYETGQLTFLDNGGQKFGKITFTSGLIRYIDERFIDIELVSNMQTGLKIPISSLTQKEFYTVPASYKMESGEDKVGFLKETVNGDGTRSSVFVEANIYLETKPEDNSEGELYFDSKDIKDGDILIRNDSSRQTVGQKKMLEGVYCVNKGYAVFRRVEIKDQNSDFCIIDENTSYGISLYDFIVKDSRSVREEDITA